MSNCAFMLVGTARDTQPQVRRVYVFCS